MGAGRGSKGTLPGEVSGSAARRSRCGRRDTTKTAIYTGIIKPPSQAEQDLPVKARFCLHNYSSAARKVQAAFS